MQKKFYLWLFAGLASLTALYVHVQIAPRTPSVLAFLSPARLTAAVGNAFGGEFDPSAFTRDALRDEGFFIRDIRVGKGVEAGVRTTVVVHYTLATVDGTVLRDTRATDTPYTFTVGAGDVVQGLSIGMIGMREGGVRTLVIPPAYAYGDTPVSNVPAGASLVFTVELLSVK